MIKIRLILLLVFIVTSLVTWTVSFELFIKKQVKYTVQDELNYIKYNKYIICKNLYKSSIYFIFSYNKIEMPNNTIYISN